MRGLITYIKSYFLQFLLSIVAFFSWIESKDLGHEYHSDNGTFEKIVDGEYVNFGTSVAITSGFGPGALAMGSTCCVCIVMIVWIEINKRRNGLQK